jgi:hypothetical protein
MTQKIHNSNHINIKIVNTKTKKRKSKHRKHALAQHSYAATPHMPHSITPFFNYPAPPPLTNKPYYVETNSQLQLKDADKPTPASLHGFVPPPPLPQFEHDEQSSYHHQGNDARDDMSDVSARTNRHHSNYLNLSHLYPGEHHTENFYNPLNFHDHSTVKEPEFHDQSQDINKPNSLMERIEYERQMKLANRRAQYSERVAPTKAAKAEQKQEKEEQKAQMKQEKAEHKAKQKQEKASSIPVRSKKK